MLSKISKMCTKVLMNRITISITLNINTYVILTLKRYLKYYAIHAKKYLDIFGDIARNEYIDTETQETLYI